MREYINQTKRLREIEVLTLSPEFESLKKSKLVEYQNELKQLILKIGGKDHDQSFESTHSRISNKLESMRASNRFRLQIFISLIILSVGIFNLVK